MSERKAQLERKSKETEMKIDLNVDGKGQCKIKTNIGILDHMLELFSFHGFFDLDLDVKKADLQIDIHHTNEDIGIVLGKAFKKALGEKEGIRRFGSGFAPMESTLGHSVIDISGRGYSTVTINGPLPDSDEDGYKFKFLEHFLESFAHNLGANFIVTVTNPKDSTADMHTILETVFKSLGLALDQATQIDSRRGKAVPSTKGIID
jgi:imidazoleglycerol-phosphate dehydratase